MTAVVLVPAGLIFACSGPGAGAAIAENIAYAQAHALVVLTALEVSALIWLCVRRSRGWPLASALLLLLHPAWTVSALDGDCGALKAQASVLFTVLAAGCLVGQITHLTWSWTESLPTDSDDGPSYH
jgi:hypothetical protein